MTFLMKKNKMKSSQKCDLFKIKQQIHDQVKTKKDIKEKLK
jgi:hypothetical protein